MRDAARIRAGEKTCSRITTHGVQARAPSRTLPLVMSLPWQVLANDSAPASNVAARGFRRRATIGCGEASKRERTPMRLENSMLLRGVRNLEGWRFDARAARNPDGRVAPSPRFAADGQPAEKPHGRKRRADGQVER